MDKIEGIAYEELVCLRNTIEARLKEFRPIRIKKKFKRCGKKACFCAGGPASNEWENLHGPYVFAQFIDAKTGKARNLSLGRWYGEDQVNEVSYKRIAPARYFAMPESDHQTGCVYFHRLTDEEFVSRYGVAKREDNFDCPDVLYGTRASSDAYEVARRQLEQEKEAVAHAWCMEFGIGSYVGQKRLADLLRGNYYLMPGLT